jgi:hypothetical protein
VGALAHYIESEGIATTQVSLIREHTAAINPPRALWVPFILGRPFGVPGDAAFQERVLFAALRLLEAPSGPLLADYPEEAPATGEEDRQVCPVSFENADEGTDLPSAFLREVEALRSWHDLARERRQRSTVGLSGIAIEQAAHVLANCAKGEPPQRVDGMTAGEALKLACEDIRAYYCEAAAARPGSPDAESIQKWFWNETAGGRMFLALHEQCTHSADESLQRLCATSLVPRAVLRGRQAS